MKLLFILLILVSCGKNTDKPIAMVRIGDTIYHCERVYQQNCGMVLVCKGKNFSCMQNVEIEWLK